MKITRVLALLPALVVAAACSAPSQQASTATDVPPVPTVASKSEHGSAATPAVLDAVGPGCADLPLSDDPGSLANMRLQPVATAVEANPDLSVLHQAIERAGLTDTLNTAPGLTVFAPTDEAFAAVPQAVLNDPARLTELLEYHVSTARHTAAELHGAGISQQMAGGDLRIGGTVEEMTVTDGAGTVAAVTCGDITTQNANVFLVDHVLMPS